MKKILTTTLLGVACLTGAYAQSMTIVENDGTVHKFNTDYVEELRFEEVASGLNITFTEASGTGYSYGAADLEFNDGQGNKLILYVTLPSNPVFLPAGEYNVSAAERVFDIEPDVRYSSYNTADGAAALESGGMTVALDESTGIYDIDFNLMLADGEALKGKYKGIIQGFGPSQALDLTSTKAILVDVAGSKDGQMRVRFSNDGSSFEATVDFFTIPGSSELPDGTYVNGTADGEPFTFGPSSQVALYRPYSDPMSFTGALAVSRNDIGVLIEGDITLSDGRTARLWFNGEISGN